MAKPKLIQTAFLIITSLNALLDLQASPSKNYALTLDYNNSSFDDINHNTLKEVLKTMKSDNMRCLYRSGINDESFEVCCGENYKKIQEPFLAVYKQKEQELTDDFKERVLNSCDYDKSPCETLVQELYNAKIKDRDLIDELMIPKEELEIEPGVKPDDLDEAFNQFKLNYNAFKDVRVLITQEMNDNVDEIKKLISKTGVKLKTDYREFKPEFGFKDIEMNNEDDSQAIGDEVATGVNQFHNEMLQEAEAKKEILSDIARGFITEADIKQGQLPSKILDDVRNIIRMKNSTIGL